MFDLNDVLNGAYIPEAATIKINSSREQLLGAWGLLYNLESMERRKSIGEQHEIVKPALTLIHEQAHFKQINNTNFGLYYFSAMQNLVWRAESFLQYCAVSETEIPHFSKINSISSLLPEILSSDDVKQMKRIDGNGDHINLSDNSIARILSDYDRLLVAVNVLANRVGVNDNDLYSAADAVNEICFSKLAHVSKQKETDFSPYFNPSSVELMEIHARLSELNSIATFRLGDEFLRFWWKRNVPPKIEPMMRWLLSNIGAPQTCLDLIEVAFMGPWIPSGGAGRDQVLITDLDPGFRLQKLVQEACRSSERIRDKKEWRRYLWNELPIRANVLVDKLDAKTVSTIFSYDGWKSLTSGAIGKNYPSSIRNLITGSPFFERVKHSMICASKLRFDDAVVADEPLPLVLLQDSLFLSNSSGTGYSIEDCELVVANYLYRIFTRTVLSLSRGCDYPNFGSENDQIKLFFLSLTPQDQAHIDLATTLFKPEGLIKMLLPSLR